MWNRWTCWLAAVLLICGCSGCSQGTLTRVVRTDGTAVVGELVAARPEAVIVKIADGTSVTIPRATIKSIETASASAAAPSASSNANPSATSGGKSAAGGSATSGSAPSNSAANNSAPSNSAVNNSASNNAAKGGTGITSGAGPSPNAPVAREVTAPSGTLIELSLNTPIGSDTSAIDDKVDAVLRAPVIVNGTQVLGAGTAAHGIVTEATPATKASAGRGRLSVRFETIQLGQKSLAIQAAPVRWEAPPPSGGAASRDEAAPRNLWGRIVRKTKKGLRIGDDDRARGSAGAGAGAGTEADVRFAAGAIVRIRLEQAARIAP